MEDKISVIIPIYNVERYLHQCLDSIVKQTYKNLEILLIDDGSPDHCGVICDEYASRDPRIRVTHKQNGGLSAAWNDGLSMATGKWIAFVDSDDWIELDYFELMMSGNQGCEPDLIQSSGYFRENEKNQYVWRSYLEPFIFENGTGKEFMTIHTLFRSKDKNMKATVSNVWGKLYRASFLREKGFQFDAQVRAGLANDLIFNIEIYMKAQTIVGISYYGYHYRVTADSGTFKYDPNRPEKEIHVNQKLKELIVQPGNSEDLKKAFESYCLRDIVHNLERCYFHPDSSATRQNVARGIREMKRLPYCKDAIASYHNPYNGVGLKVFQMALRLPFVWPLRVLVNTWHALDERGNKSMT